jgi:uncharacterized RDD family membrane protein YckC
MNIQAPHLYYAAWWRRFAALLIDLLVLLPLIIVQMRIGSTSPRAYAAILLPFTAITLGYWVFCHGRWGRTVGKLLTGTRVTTLDGTAISWPQAFIRSSVDIALTGIACLALISAYCEIPTEGYAQLAARERYALLTGAWPRWYPLVTTTQQIWIWSEFIVILLNRRRRALHDFLAGTIVIQTQPTRRQAREEDPSNIDWEKEMKRLQKQRL